MFQPPGHTSYFCFRRFVWSHVPHGILTGLRKIYDIAHLPHWCEGSASWKPLLRSGRSRSPVMPCNPNPLSNRTEAMILALPPNSKKLKKHVSSTCPLERQQEMRMWLEKLITISLIIRLYWKTAIEQFLKMSGKSMPRNSWRKRRIAAEGSSWIQNSRLKMITSFWESSLSNWYFAVQEIPFVLNQDQLVSWIPWISCQTPWPDLEDRCMSSMVELGVSWFPALK